MPLYEFRCSTWGIFEEWRSLVPSSEPAFCPECQQLGQRIFQFIKIYCDLGFRVTLAIARGTVKSTALFLNKGHNPLL
ncbi:zinc ribbon domain-containing protein [Thermosynechococcus sp. FA-CM-4201]